jgi:hypothetical protein
MRLSRRAAFGLGLAAPAPAVAHARIVIDSGLADPTGWAEVDPLTFASHAAADIQIVGDANNAAPPEGVYFNPCCSHVGEAYGISIAGIYRPGPNGVVEVPNCGGVAPRAVLPERRRLEAAHAGAWYASMTRDMFGA